MKTNSAARNVLSPGTGQNTAAEAVRMVQEFSDAVANGAIPGEESAAWQAVAHMLAELNLDLEYVVAGLVGPLVERDLVGLGVVRKHLGDPIAQLVEGLVRFDEFRSPLAWNDSATNQKVQFNRLRKLLLTAVDNVQILIVQLALALHRLRTAREDRSQAEREQLAREGLDLYAPLASRLGIWHYKWEIEDLAFRESNPETYRNIAHQLNERRIDRERSVDAAVQQLSTALELAGTRAHITGRAKHIYSIWRKMRQKSFSIEQMSDLRAIRVLVDTTAQCYTTLGIVHGLWKHIPREFNDYVNHPKPNGYQSLHTAVIGQDGRTLEVQIRTHEMHDQAELGIAAHWRYKEGIQNPDPTLDERILWLRRLLDNHEGIDESGPLLDSLNSELESGHVYAFTPKGKIIDLPIGSTPLDFAYQIHTEIGHRCRGAKVNGQIMPLLYKIHLGDRIEVITTRQPHVGPSRDWLNPNLGYLRSPRSRAKVRHWFRHQDRERNVADGQEIWERKRKQLGIEDPDYDAVAKRFNAPKFDDFLAALGRGDISGAQLVGALQSYLPQPRLKTLRPRKKPDSIDISGVGNLLTQIARCCKPLPYDAIMGYITRGRGVSVHRSDCHNVLNLTGSERARLIDVAWGSDTEEIYPVELAVKAFDRKGLLRDTTNVVANETVNVIAMDSQTDRHSHIVYMRITVEVRDIKQLSRVLDRVGQISNVLDCRRLG